MIEDIFKRKVRQHLQSSELTSQQNKQPLATHPINHPIKQDITQHQHQQENISNTVHKMRRTKQTEGVNQDSTKNGNKSSQQLYDHRILQLKTPRHNFLCATVQHF